MTKKTMILEDEEVEEYEQLKNKFDEAIEKRYEEIENREVRFKRSSVFFSGIMAGIVIMIIFIMMVLGV